MGYQLIPLHLLTNAMVYTMPMLAITTIIATNIFDDVKENENRVDDGDGMDMRFDLTLTVQ